MMYQRTVIGGYQDPESLLLLHMDGADNGTVFIDSSKYNRAITRSNVFTQTSYKVLGIAAGKFNGTPWYLSIPASSDWNFGLNATIDFRIYPYNLVHNRCAFAWSYGATDCISLWNNNGKFLVDCYNSSGTRFYIPGTTTMSTSAWYHIAIVLDGSYVRLFVNGVQEAYASISGTFNLSAKNLYIGCASPNNYHGGGYIDEFRVLNKPAWTSNFTPLTRPYTR